VVSHDAVPDLTDQVLRADQAVKAELFTADRRLIIAGCSCYWPEAYSVDRSGRSAWPELAPGLTPDSIKQKISSDRRVDADRPRLRAVFGGGKTFLHSLDPLRTWPSLRSGHRIEGANMRLVGSSKEGNGAEPRYLVGVEN